MRPKLLFVRFSFGTRAPLYPMQFDDGGEPSGQGRLRSARDQGSQKQMQEGGKLGDSNQVEKDASKIRPSMIIFCKKRGGPLC